jgi:hypothetical protein
MAEAFERKRQDMLRWSTDEDSRVGAFATWLIEGLDQIISWERLRVEEGMQLRKYRYGELLRYLMSAPFTQNSGHAHPQRLGSSARSCCRRARKLNDCFQPAAEIHVRRSEMQR